MRRWPVERSYRHQEVGLLKMAHHRLGAAQLARLGEQMEQPRVHFFIRIEANPAIATIRQPGRQRHPQLASRRLLRSPQEGDAFRTALLGPSELRAASRVRTRLLAGGRRIRTTGPSRVEYLCFDWFCQLEGWKKPVQKNPRLRQNFALFLAQVIDIVCTAGVGLSTQ